MMVIRDGEFAFLILFAKNEDLFFRVVRQQLRSLWTAYCMHHAYEVDTANYDTALAEVWKSVSTNKTNYWKDDEDERTTGFDLFEGFMCEEVQ